MGSNASISSICINMAQNFKIAVLGYGSQGRAWALNLADSGCEITIGLPSGDKTRRTAKKDGIRNITTPSRAVSSADIIIFAFPDHLHGRVFLKDIIPNLKEYSALVFLHGYSIHFGTVKPPDKTDIILLAPLGPGVSVREKYLENDSIGYFYGIHQNGSGRAKTILNYLSGRLKIKKSMMIETTFEDEAVGDLFGEQAVLCGGLTQLIKSGYETLVASGLSSDKAYLEVAYQLDLIISLIKKYGIEGMYNRISVTARFGLIENGRKIIGADVKNNMKKVLSEIKNGRFAEKFNKLDKSGMKKLNRDIKTMTTQQFEKSAAKFSTIKTRKKK
ncbi:MAG: ketol-acid reductoisomerase [Candidatus Zixiibacteriota bacterium]